jgi:hypothetical protein
MHDFLNVVTYDFNRIVQQSIQMHENLMTLKEIVIESEVELRMLKATNREKKR